MINNALPKLPRSEGVIHCVQPIEVSLFIIDEFVKFNQFDEKNILSERMVENFTDT